MKYWTLPILTIALVQAACSGGNPDATDTVLIDDPTSITTGAPFVADELMNDANIGPEPNYWNCRLRQNDATVSLEANYQFFLDFSGVVFTGPGSEAFTWDATGDGLGFIDIINAGGTIPLERWFVSKRSATNFSAAIAYGQTRVDLNAASPSSKDADILCVLYIVDDGAVNPADESLLSQLDDGSGSGSGDTSIAGALLNDNSEFGLENQLWQCIAIDGTLDLLLGFYANGIGGIYNTRNGRLEGSQTTYTVSESNGIGNVSIDEGISNQAGQMQLSNIIFERANEFEATLRSSITNNDDVLISCNTLATSELAL